MPKPVSIYFFFFFTLKSVSLQSKVPILVSAGGCPPSKSSVKSLDIRQSEILTLTHRKNV